ncbi:MAG: MFS transporter [Telluria sp.]
MSKESLSLGPSASPVPDAAAAPRRKVPLSRPLRHARFRNLWLANLVSNLGTWTQTFASAWLIASLAHSGSTTTLVQTATYGPIFLFAIFAGVVADAVHPPKFLFLCNAFMVACAAAMAALVVSGMATALPVLALTFCLGTGNAFIWPAWQASMSSLVEPEEIEAVTTLNNLSYSVAGIVGPAAGGLLFNWIGPGALFLANAVSFAGLLNVYWRWWREGGPPRGHAASGDYWSNLRAGMARALGCPRYRYILVTVCAVFFITICFAALLPLFVRDVLRTDSSVFGTLMGSLGAGAVSAAFFLPGLRTRVERKTLLAGALLVYGAMLVTMPHLRSLAALVPLIVCGGMSWSAIVTTLNAAAQSAFPPEIRARTLSIYLFTMAAGYTSGSLLWGQFSDRFGIALAYTAAGIALAALALATARRKNPI